MEVYNTLIVDQLVQGTSTTSPSSISSVVSCGISVLSLIMTMIYSSYIQEPQMVPGWMLVLLCVSLLLAQILSILISTLHISSRLCQILGLTHHFCQLTYLFWISVSTYHLFKVFTKATNQSSTTLSSSAPVWYTVYVYSAATVFVLINMTVQLATSQAEDMGYSGPLCFINTDYMIGTTLLLPLFVHFCAETVMVILVILRTGFLPDIKKSTTKWIKTFHKLSALTGLTWLSDLVYHWTDLNVFFYLYVVFNAGQSLFIFVAFVLNNIGLNLRKKSAAFPDLKD